ncbi:MAG: hypothetical protein C4538_07265 [Nitrospiraceae bacterium]|nr:MAG: hypothetical protein C4538_07265 [Nitrospiraceae bacterium]
MSKVKSVIIKKVKKGGGGGHHGGAWKVAYADFVTAMMAFFLLMWLLNMTSDEKRARLSTYFKYFSIYDSGGTSWMDKSSEIFSESGESQQKALLDKYSKNISNMKEMEEELKKGLMKELGDAKDQVIIDTVDGGVRIQMTDKDGSLMFDLGNNKLTPKAREILRVIGENIKSLPNKIAIEGHTDSLQYSGNDYSNWELSTERASSARRELEANGLSSERIIRVSGFADKDPLIPENPSDPRNRRISIILKAPFISDNVHSKSNDKQLSDNKSIVSARKKEEGEIMVEKFEENLSLIKNGMNAAQKNIEDNAMHQKVKEAPDKNKPENTNWGAVIKKNEWSPVMKDELKPAITGSGQNDNPLSATAPSEKQTENRPRDVQIPAITRDTFIPAKNQPADSSTPKKKSDVQAPVKNEPTAKSKEVTKEPAIIKEFQSPVLSKDILGPVISK